MQVLMRINPDRCAWFMRGDSCYILLQKEDKVLNLIQKQSRRHSGLLMLGKLNAGWEFSAIIY